MSVTEEEKTAAREDLEGKCSYPYFGIGKLWVDVDRMSPTTFQTIRKLLKANYDPNILP